MRLHSVLFSAVICAFLCGPAVLLEVQKAGVAVPDWLTGNSAKYLTGGTSNVQVAPYLNIEGFAGKDLQAAIEDKIGNFIPMKASALLTNAKLQRCAITESDEVARWSCIPTHYDSPIVYSEKGDFLAQMPLVDAVNAQRGVERFAAGLADVARRFPEKQFVVIVADNSNTSEANPALGLVAGAYTTADAVNVFYGACSGLDNLFVSEVNYQDPQEYYQYFYRTDHHWNGYGAVDAYVKSLDAFDDDTASALHVPLEQLPPLTGLEWLSEHGSACRNGLMIIDEPVNEPSLPLSGVLLEKGAAPPVAADDGVALMREAGPIASYDFYQTWYGQWRDTVAVNDSASLPDSSALVICDSFGTAFKWVASTGFGRVSTLYDLHDSRTEAVPLSRTLSESDADTIFLVARVTSYQKALDRFPEYFE